MNVNMVIDKTALLQEIIQKLETEIQALRGSFKEAKLTSIEAPGRMQSRYDTMGVEAAWVADGLAKSIEEKVEGTYRLKNINLPDSPERVSLGCVVGIGPDGGDIENVYFILPACGGMIITIPNSDLTVQTVMLQAPVARALIGKSIDDEVAVRKGRGGPDVILHLS
jgi:hypothetical protein